jgi:hypothetical protein
VSSSIVVFSSIVVLGYVQATSSVSAAQTPSALCTPGVVFVSLLGPVMDAVDSSASEPHANKNPSVKRHKLIFLISTTYAFNWRSNWLSVKIFGRI